MTLLYWRQHITARMHSWVNHHPNVIGLKYYFKPFWWIFEWVRRCNMYPLKIRFQSKTIWQCKSGQKYLKEIAILCLKSHDSQLGYSFPSLQSAVVRQQPKNKWNAPKTHVFIGGWIRKGHWVFPQINIFLKDKRCHCKMPLC